MDGVAIGSDVVVGAGAVVTEDLPDGGGGGGRAGARGAPARAGAPTPDLVSRRASWS